jgi:hypothetical protein
MNDKEALKETRKILDDETLTSLNDEEKLDEILRILNLSGHLPEES